MTTYLLAFLSDRRAKPGTRHFAFSCLCALIAACGGTRHHTEGPGLREVRAEPSRALSEELCDRFRLFAQVHAADLAQRVDAPLNLDLCRIAEAHSAGGDDRNRRLTVARLALHPADHPHADGSAAIGYDANGEAIENDTCALSVWVSLARGAPEDRFEVITAVCNNGYGAANVGEDSFEVGPNRVSYGRSGGSAWRWSETVTERVSPRTVLARASSGSWSLADNQESTVVDFERLQASGSWYAPRCGASSSGNDSITPYQWVSVPRVRVSSTDLGADLGSCGVRVDGRDGNGFVLEEQGETGAGDFRAAWVADGPLILEVHDDRIEADDAIELFTTSEETRPSYMEHCVEPSIATVDTLRVPLIDDGTRDGVRRVPISGGVRLEIDLPLRSRLSIALVDHDGTATRRISTSSFYAEFERPAAVTPSDPRAIGDVFSPRNGRCEPVNGALSPAMADDDLNDAP